ncbi:MAG: bifunctional precorrin-2 dehydrogenase/sirohydrochlorin ferrochelatase [Methanosarcinales archaeon]|uniref:precorrin-2 dehydrogenase n=1 Tax=Candidatus Ethanoperedens thermophilum TaxID=2766897 RepID=A0A848D8J1_9EURY|nr:bifunctional precorrin-2 dehydrogenase/sirohydrochlorin ferrochelatase [Candidatus Ethanoperedens thermophilum]
MKTHLPLFIDVRGRKIVVFGGGAVGKRKASLFLQYADVTVISKDFIKEFQHLENKVTLIKSEEITEELIESYVKDAFLVVPSTNSPDLNTVIERLAKEHGALVNRVDKVSEVIVPSVINRDSITIAISTDAMSPALSRYMRERVEEVITPEFGMMAKLQNEMREILKKEITNQHERKRILFDILNDETIWLALGESYEKAYSLSLSYVR